MLTLITACEQKTNVVTSSQLESPQPVSTKLAMTWRVLNIMTLDGRKHALFGADELTNPYKGDTNINEVRSLLCFKKSSLSAPSGLPGSSTTPGGAVRDSWSGGRVLILSNIQASTLTSQAIADEKCRLEGLKIGENNFRMAEFHDGNAWSFWADASSTEAVNNPEVRYWVQINDQPANPW